MHSCVVLIKWGRDRHGTPRLKCTICGKTRIASYKERKKNSALHGKIEHLLAGGFSVRQIACKVGCNKNTVLAVTRQLYTPSQLKTKRREFWPYLDSATSSWECLLLLIGSIIPRELPEDIRCELGQDLAVSCLTGELEQNSDAIRVAVQSYLKAVYKRSRDYGTISINYPAPWSTNGRPLSDLLVDKTGLFE